MTMVRRRWSRSYWHLLVLLLVVLPYQAFAYGTDGHRIVANLCWYLLSEDVKDEINDLLDEEWLSYWFQILTKCRDCKPLGEVSEWADDIKSQRASTPSHAVAFGCASDAEEGSDGEVYAIDRSRAFDIDKTYKNNVIGNVVEFSLDLQSHVERRKRRRRQRGRRELFFVPLVVSFLMKLWDQFMGTFFGFLDEKLDDVFLDEERESLMFLTHMMGDLHQPLHCGCKEDNDGLDIWVKFFDFYNKEEHPFPFICWILPSFLDSFLGCDLNLHLVWDNSIITKTLQNDHGGSRKALENDIWYEYIEDNESQREAWISCLPDTSTSTTVSLERSQISDCVLEWANESLQLAIEYSYRDGDGTVVATGSHLEQEYYEKVLPVVRKQLAAGAVRFAALLEHVLQPVDDDDDDDDDAEPIESNSTFVPTESNSTFVPTESDATLVPTEANESFVEPNSTNTVDDGDP